MMSRCFTVVAAQGVLQVAIIVVTARFPPGSELALCLGRARR